MMRITKAFPRRGAGGFTLIELLVTLTVLGILSVIAVPSFNNAILGSKLASFSNSFVASVSLARSEAIKRNATVKICRSADGTNCATSGGWQQGWIVFNDTDGNDAINGSEQRFFYQQALANGFQLTGDNYSVQMLPTGLAAASANLVLCRNNPAGSQERSIVLGTTGRVSVTKTTNGTCS